VKVTVSEKDDALYFRLDQKPIVGSEEVRPGVILDYDERDQVVGLELYHALRTRLRRGLPHRWPACPSQTTSAGARCAPSTWVASTG
jgi:uncharacterized protein YuzE